MAYIIGEHKDGDKIAKNGGSFGPQFEDADVAKASVLKIWGSSFTDPDGDWCRFDLLDQDGKCFKSRTIAGY